MYIGYRIRFRPLDLFALALTDGAFDLVYLLTYNCKAEFRMYHNFIIGSYKAYVEERICVANCDL